MTRLRIAFARIAQETNALSPVATTLDDFRRTHFIEGEELLRACGPEGYEAPGFLKRAELAGFVRAARDAGDAEVEPVPLFSAWAAPSGPLTREAYEHLRQRLCDGLRAARPLQGVFLCLHGAMGVAGVRDPDGGFITAARETVGAGVPIAVTHDLHANLTRTRIEAADLLVGYRTNPHRDFFATGRRTGELLVRTILGRVRPTTAWRSLPMLLGGGAEVDLLPPMLGIFARLRALTLRPRVLNANVYMCHPWNDDPELGWSTVVTTNGDADLAERLADDLAERCWAVRNVPPPRFASAEEAVARAREARLARRLGVVVMSDTSDVVAAGAPGENTRLLEALLSATDLTSFVPLRDPKVVADLWETPIGERVTVRVGGKLDPRRNRPLEVTGTVLRAQRMPGYERMVVLDLGPVRLVLTEGPALAMRPSFYEQVGLSVWKADVVVVKSFFPFLLAFLASNRKTIFVRTAGVTDPDASFALEFAGPVHPRDVVDDWRPADRRRRGITDRAG